MCVCDSVRSVGDGIRIGERVAVGAVADAVGSVPETVRAPTAARHEHGHERGWREARSEEAILEDPESRARRRHAAVNRFSERLNDSTELTVYVRD